MKAIEFQNEEKSLFTEYDVQIKGSKLAILNPYGLQLKVPKGVSVKYDVVNKPNSFQFFVGNTPITPILTKVKELEKGIVALTKSGELIFVNLENKTFTESFEDWQNNMVVHKNGAISVVRADNTLRKTPYEFQAGQINDGFAYSYFLKDLVSVMDSDGKCAIFDTMTGRPVSDFMFEPNEFKVVDALNLRPEIVDSAYYVVKLGDVNKHNETLSDKYVILRDDGVVIKTLSNCKLLWTNNQNIDKPNDRFSYIAFVKRNKNNELVTQILKLDPKTSKFVSEIEIPEVANKLYQPGKEITFLPDGRMVLISANPEHLSSTKGAYLISPNGRVEQIVKNEMENVELLRSLHKGFHFSYKKGETFGRVAINNRSHTFETSRNSFALNMLKYFGNSNPETAKTMPNAITQTERPKLKPIENNEDSAKQQNQQV